MENNIKPGSAAPDVTVLDARGKEISLASLWMEKPLVLIFVRHLG